VKALVVDPVDRIADVDRDGSRVELEIGKMNVDRGQERTPLEGFYPEG
jgi:hypothetical protein